MNIGATSRTPKGARAGAATYAADQGMPFLCAAGAHGTAVQSALVDAGTAGSLAVTFAGQSLTDMADANYAVLVQMEGVTDAYIDESTKTTAGFTIIKGAGVFANEIANIVVVGRLAGQLGPDGP